MLLCGAAAGLGGEPHVRTPAERNGCAQRGLKRTGQLSSPGSSHENLMALHATCVIQRALRARWRRACGPLADCNGASAHDADAHHEGGCTSAFVAAEAVVHRAGAASSSAGRRARRPNPATVLGGALLCGLAACSAAAAEVPTACDGAFADCPAAAAAAPDNLVSELDGVAAAEAAAAAEAGLAAQRAQRTLFGVATGGRLERAVLAVLLRYALVKLMHAEHVDALLNADVGPFAQSLFLGTSCGVVARSLAAHMSAYLAARRVPDGMPRLPPQRRRTAHRAGVQVLRSVGSGGLTRAFGTGAVQLLAFNTLRAAEASVNTSLPEDGGLLLAGAAAGCVAAVATRPLDSAVVAARGAARAALRGDPTAAVRVLLLLDVCGFAALEAACGVLGLDPVPAL
jgi:hypothetical protein